jgi:hypothetical protein
MQSNSQSLAGVEALPNTELESAPQSKKADPPASSTRALNNSLIFVSIRCTLQYVILPFVLPWFGLGGIFSIVISLVLEVVALGSIIFNIWQLWNTSWRWRYLGLSALMISIIILFLYLDVQHLLQF